MRSVQFPNLFSGNSTAFVEDAPTNAILKTNDATLQSLHLLLSSETSTLFGDPEFGVRLRRYMFEQNNYILHDILVDEIYTKICIFCPWVYIQRKDVHLLTDNSSIYVSISCQNQLSFEVNTYNLKLYDLDQEES